MTSLRQHRGHGWMSDGNDVTHGGYIRAERSCQWAKVADDVWKDNALNMPGESLDNMTNL